MVISPRRHALRDDAPGPNRTPTVIAAAVAATIAMAGPAWADPLSVGEFGQLALRCGASVAPSTLASIARTESSFQPLSINDNTTGTSGVPASRDIAIQIASKLLEAGHSVDVGIMQINSGNFARLGLTLEAAFDPCRSVAAAAVILAGDYAGQVRRYLEPAPIVLVSSRWRGRANIIMTMGWHTVMEFTPSLVGCVIASSNHSFHMVRGSGEWVINLPTTKLTDEVVGIGNTTGAETNKFTHFGLTTDEAAAVGAPLIRECHASFECRHHDGRLIDRYNFFIFEVVRGRVAASPKHPETLHYTGDGQFVVSQPSQPAGPDVAIGRSWQRNDAVETHSARRSAPEIC